MGSCFWAPSSSAVQEWALWALLLIASLHLTVGSCGSPRVFRLVLKTCVLDTSCKDSVGHTDSDIEKAGDKL